ncbi:MAG: gamma-glutamylcyclotransferase, partial [Aquificae bacterium]|nr:gamma-glutamylcyclotransferase [Aquificota bacterium]
MEKVFVYGTLKRGCGAHELVLEAGGRFIAEAVTKDLWVMRTNGLYPAVLPSESGHPVAGELYELPEEGLKLLDRYEGYPELYGRKKVAVLTADGRLHEAWIYYLKPENLPLLPTEVKPRNGLLFWPC